MGWRRAASVFLSCVSIASKPPIKIPSTSSRTPHFLHSSNPAFRFQCSRLFSAVASPFSFTGSQFESEFEQSYDFEVEEGDEIGKIPIKAYFLCTSINLKNMQSENLSNIIPPTSRSSNYIALRYIDFPPETSGVRVKGNSSCCRYMVVFQYGSAVLFNIEDHEVEGYLDLVRRHASGLLPDIKKDDYAVKEKPYLVEDMQGGPDYIVLKSLDTDGVRIIGSVLGQSIALDYFVSQGEEVLIITNLEQVEENVGIWELDLSPRANCSSVDSLVEEFADINRKMEKTGTFTMDKKKLLQLVGKANSNLADVILKVGLFERSEIAWRDAKYAQIYEYLREEYEVTQRFGNLDFKLKFVEHNIHFLQEVLQNRKSDLLEWCIIGLLTIENIISLYEIVKDSTPVHL